MLGPVVHREILDLALQGHGVPCAWAFIVVGTRLSPVALGILRFVRVKLVSDHFWSKVDDVTDLILSNLHNISSCVDITKHEEIRDDRRPRFTWRIVHQVLAEVLADLTLDVLLLLLGGYGNLGLVHFMNHIFLVIVITEAVVLARQQLTQPLAEASRPARDPRQLIITSHGRPTLTCRDCILWRHRGNFATCLRRKAGGSLSLPTGTLVFPLLSLLAKALG